ncbi:MAG: hypothetical protein OHK0053_32290 [Microscillaceae bacterium]
MVDTEIEKDTFNFAFPKKTPDGVIFRAVGAKDKFWPNGSTLRVRFIGGSAYVRNKVRQYVKAWSEHANIRFQFVESGTAEIRVAFILRAGSYSYVGTDALNIPQSQHTMNFGWFYEESTEEKDYKSTILHEFGHALGLMHEHQHPEGGIRWNREALYRYFGGPPNNWSRSQVDRQILNRFTRNETQFTRYDRNSIMHYSYPAQVLLDGIAINPNLDLSPTDIAFIKQIYPKSNSGGGITPVEPNPPTPPVAYSQIRINSVLGDWQRAEDVYVEIGDYKKHFVLDYYSRKNGAAVFNLPVGKYPYKIVTSTIFYGYRLVQNREQYYEFTLYGYDYGTIEIRNDACFDLYGDPNKRNPSDNRWFYLSLQRCK